MIQLRQSVNTTRGRYPLGANLEIISANQFAEDIRRTLEKGGKEKEEVVQFFSLLGINEQMLELYLRRFSPRLVLSLFDNRLDRISQIH